MTGLVLGVAGLLSLRILQAAGRAGGPSADELVPGFSAGGAGAIAALVVFVLLASAARYFVRSARVPDAGLARQPPARPDPPASSSSTTTFPPPSPWPAPRATSS